MRYLIITLSFIIFIPLVLLGQNGKVNLDSGLVACYPFNGNAKDESGNGNDGTVHGATLTSDRFGNPNSAYSFNGSSNYIMVPYSKSLDINYDLTICLWLNINNLSKTLQIPLFHGDEQPNVDPYVVMVRTDFVSYWRCTGNGSTPTEIKYNMSNTVLNQWHFVTVKYDNISKNMYVYFDGIQKIKQYQPALIQYNTSTFWTVIGAGDAGERYNFSGFIDDIKIYNRALSDAEIQALYTANSNCISCPSVNLGKDTTICNGNSLVLNAGNTGSTYIWNTGSTTQKITVSNAGKYFVTVSNGSCSVTGSINISVSTVPIVKLGKDTTINNNSTIKLHAGNNYIYYKWQDGSTDSNYTVTIAGKYWVTVKNNSGCQGSDTIIISNQIKINLDSGLVACYPFNGNANDESGNGNNGTVKGATLTTDRFGNPNSAYSFDGTDDYIEVLNSPSLKSIETNQQLTVTSWVNIYDWYQGWNIFSVLDKYKPSNGGGWCVELYRTGYNIPGSGLGFSSDIVHTGSFYSINFKTWYFIAISYDVNKNHIKFYINGLLTYTATYSQPISDTENGPLYIGYSPTGSVEYSDGLIDDIRIYNRVLTDDEIKTIYNGNSTCRSCPSITLGKDTTICNGNSLIINAGNPGSTYIWNTGATTQTITVSYASKYFVTVTNGSCSVNGSINISVSAVPIVKLGKDTTICKEKSIILNAGNPGSNFIWNTGDITQTILVSNSGKYMVTVTNGSCSSTGSINILVDVSPKIYLGKDTTICPNTELILNLHNDTVRYTWSDNSHNNTLKINKSGQYSVTITDKYGCTSSNTINISQYSDSESNLDLGNARTICNGCSIVINAGNKFKEYTWQNGSKDSTLTVNTSGTYSVTATDEYGCKYTDSIIIFEECDGQDLFIPNCFTPNGDNLDDMFQIVTSPCYTNYDMKIYNRWGALLYETNDISKGWDGKFNNHNVSEGVYVYIITYYNITNSNSKMRKQGTVTLLR